MVRLKCLFLQSHSQYSFFQQTSKNSLLLRSCARVSVLSVCVESVFRVSNKIIVTIFTVSGGGGALGLGEALENRVRPLVEGGELKCLEGADGQTGERKQRKRRMEKQKGRVSL